MWQILAVETKKRNSNTVVNFQRCERARQLQYTSSCTVLLYFSRYCTVRLKMFSFFFVLAFLMYILFVWKVIMNLLQYNTTQWIVVVGYPGSLCGTYEQIRLRKRLSEQNSFVSRGLPTKGGCPLFFAAHHPPWLPLDHEEQRRKVERTEVQTSASPWTSLPRLSAHFIRPELPPHCQPHQLPLPASTRELSPHLFSVFSPFPSHPQRSLLPYPTKS